MAKKIVKTHDYRDETGQLLHQVVRYEPKDFRQRRPNGEGGWTWNLDGVRKVLYRLPELLQSSKQDWIYICEGEKDADRLCELGFTATTCAMGAGKWRDEYNRHFEGRLVAVTPDNDSAGKRHAEQIATSLHGIAGEIRIVELPGLDKGGDVSDWLEAGHEARELLELIDKTKPFRPANSQETDFVALEPIATCLNDVEPKRVSWLWPDKIPMGSVSLIVGNPGLGKSVLTITMAAHVTTGQSWPDTAKVENPIGSVVLLTAEDNLADVVRVRLDAAGADVSKVIAIKGVTLRDDEGKILDEDVYFNIDQHIPALELAVERTANVRLVVIDPVSAFMGRTDSHKNAEVRKVLTKLASLAEKHNVAVVGVSHLNKNRNATANHRIIGSIAFNATARAVWYVLKDPGDPESSRRLFLPGKNNLTKEPTGLAFELVSVPDNETTGQYESVKCVFDDEPVYLTPDEALGLDESEREDSKLDKAVQWLKDALERGPVDKDEIFELADLAEISRRTLERAKAEAGITSEMSGFGEDKKSVWRLP